MTTVQQIEQAVAHLPEAELAKFRSWFAKFDAATWDVRFEADARSGRLDGLANQALDDFDQGRCREL